MKDRIDTEDEIKEAEQYEALKQMLLRLLDDPQVQQKIVTFQKPLTWTLKRSIRTSPPESSRAMSGITRSEPVRLQNSSHRCMERLLSLDSQFNPNKFALPLFRCSDQYTRTMWSASIAATGPRC